MFEAGQGVYYGISFKETELFIAARRAAYGSDRAVQRNVVLRFDRALRLIEVLEPEWPIRDVHQIFVHSRTLFVASTFDDAIDRFDLDTRIWTRDLPFKRTEGRDDQFHINSIHVSANEILLAGNAPQGWFSRLGRPFRPDASIEALGDNTHNVWPEGHRVSVCSSNAGEILRSDGAVSSIMKGSWVRGVAMLGGARWVGLSQIASRTNRARSDCSIARLAANGVDKAWTLSSFGMVHDLRSTTPDPTHNRLAFDLDEDAINRCPRFQAEQRILQPKDFDVSLNTANDPAEVIVDCRSHRFERVS